MKETIESLEKMSADSRICFLNNDNDVVIDVESVAGLLPTIDVIEVGKCDCPENVYVYVFGQPVETFSNVRSFRNCGCRM